MSERSEQWAGFPGLVEDRPALFSVDLAWAEEGIDPDRPLLVIIDLPFKTDLEGMPDPEEFTALSAVEELFEGMGEGSGDPVLVGVTLGGGSRRWCLYAPNDSFVPGLIKKMEAAAPGYHPSFQVQEDPDWQFYIDTLFPDEDQFRYAQDNEVVMQLVDSGDESETPRPIEHHVYFHKARNRSEFGTWCAQNGFDVLEEIPPSKQDPSYGLKVAHTGPAITEDIWEKTTALSQAAAKHGGEYDGWETVVMKDGKPVELPRD